MFASKQPCAHKSDETMSEWNVFQEVNSVGMTLKTSREPCNGMFTGLSSVGFLLQEGKSLFLNMTSCIRSASFK
ncbi:uncharacterized [Tachysurus ichikawai]